MSQTQQLHQRIAAGLSRLSLVLRHESQTTARAEGLTPLQAQILAVLQGRDDGLRLGDLSQELAVTSPTASDAVASLVDKALARKVADPDEHRAIRVVLTPAGRRAGERASMWSDVLRESVAALPESDAASLLRCLVSLIRNLERRGEIPLARMCASCRFFAPDRHPGQARPHHCSFIDSPIGAIDVRLDCPDFAAAAAGSRERALTALVRPD